MTLGEQQIVLAKFVSEINFTGMQRFSLDMKEFEKLTLLERRYHSMINVIVKDLNSFAFLLSSNCSENLDNCLLIHYCYYYRCCCQCCDSSVNIHSFTCQNFTLK
uniref:Uncharacterized protein n=1 Tax=Glossina pallidipes TaxID=7398 RepID=A0A1B0AIM6_GLOPL